jgi:hypothetical protein
MVGSFRVTACSSRGCSFARLADGRGFIVGDPRADRPSAKARRDTPAAKPRAWRTIRRRLVVEGEWSESNGISPRIGRRSAPSDIAAKSAS